MRGPCFRGGGGNLDGGIERKGGRRQAKFRAAGLVAQFQGNVLLPSGAVASASTGRRRITVPWYTLRDFLENVKVSSFPLGYTTSPLVNPGGGWALRSVAIRYSSDFSRALTWNPGRMFMTTAI